MLHNEAGALSSTEGARKERRSGRDAPPYMYDVANQWVLASGGAKTAKQTRQVQI